MKYKYVDLIKQMDSGFIEYMSAKLTLLHQFDHHFDLAQGTADCIP